MSSSPPSSHGLRTPVIARKTEVRPRRSPVSSRHAPFQAHPLATPGEGCARYGSEPNASQHELTAATRHLCPSHVSMEPRFLGGSEACQALVRFLGPRPIKPRARPLVRMLANSLDFQPCGRTPQAGHLSRELRPGKISRPTGPGLPRTSVHLLRPGLPGYPIRFAPPAFARSASGTFQRAAFAFGVPPGINAFHRSSGNSALPSCPRVKQYPPRGPSVKPKDLTEDRPHRLRALYAQ